MGYDPFSPVAPASINVLCIPASRLKPETFDSHVRWLQQKLAVVGRRNSTSGASGVNANSDDSALLFDFDSHSSPSFLQREVFFEPNRRPQIVLGLVDAAELCFQGQENNVTLLLQQARSGLDKLVGSVYDQKPPCNLVVFNSTSSSRVNDDLIVPPEAEHEAIGWSSEWLATTVELLGTQAIEGLRSQEVELPQAVAFNDRLGGGEPRRDILTENTQRDQAMPTLTKTNSQSHTPPPSEDDAYASTAGKIVSRALLKLQMGCWAEALDGLADGARAARDANSPAWHAKALEGMLVCLLLHAWAGKEFQIPQNCYPTNRGFSSSSAVHSIADANRVLSEKFAGSSARRLQALTAMLPGLLATVMNLYDRVAMGFDNSLPRLLICEARIRFAVMLVIIQKHGSLLNPAALEELIAPRTRLNFAHPLCLV